MTDNNCCCSSVVGIFPCSGGSNVGQLANQAAIEMTKNGKGNMMCTVGIGGRIAGLMKSAEGADEVVAIDGCPLNCAKKTLENAGIYVNEHVIITELGIKKDKDLDLKPEQVNEVLEKINL